MGVLRNLVGFEAGRPSVRGQSDVVEAGRVAMQGLLAEALRGHTHAGVRADAVGAGPADLVVGLAHVERVGLFGRAAPAGRRVVEVLQRQVADDGVVLDRGAGLVMLAGDGQVAFGLVDLAVGVMAGAGRVDTDIGLAVAGAGQGEQRTGGRSHLQFHHRLHGSLPNVEVHGSHHRVGLPLLILRFFWKYAIILRQLSTREGAYGAFPCIYYRIY